LRANHEFATLDYLRGIAAIAILILHFRHELGAVPLPFSWLAVDFFFVLSGFVLTHAYEQRLLASMTPAEFMRLRLVRLYPLYLIGTLIFIVTATASGEFHWSNPKTALTVIASLAFLPDPRHFGDHAALYLNSPAWSLFFELAANAVFAIAIFRLTNRRLLLICIASLLIAAICYGTLNIGSNWSDLLGGFPRVGFSFFAGVLTYRLWRSSSWRPYIVPPWCFGLFLLLLWVVPRSWNHSYDFVAVLMFPPIVYAAASCEPSSLRTRSIFLWLGAISYALYATHWPLLQAGQFLWPNQLNGDAPWAGLALALAAILLAALLNPIDRVLRKALNALTAGIVVAKVASATPQKIEQS